MRLHRLLVLRLLRGLRCGGRGRRGILLLGHRRLGLLRLGVLRLGRWGLRLRVCRLLGLLVLRSGLLAHRGAVLRFGHGRKRTREDRPCPAGC